MGFGREVDHRVARADQALYQRFVVDIAVDEADLIAQGVQRLRTARVGQRIEHRDVDVGAVPHCAVDEVRSDEARAAGDQEPH